MHAAGRCAPPSDPATITTMRPLHPTIALLLSSAALTGCKLGLEPFGGFDDTGLIDESDDGFDGGSGGSGGDGADGGGGGSGGDGADGGGDGADGGSGGSGGDGTEPQALTVSGADPDYGVTTGGTRVTLTGGPFDGSARVWFGAQEGSVLSSSSSTLEVQAPSTASAGAVDIRVETTTHAGRLESGFTYWADAAGQGTALGVMTFTTQVGSYWSGATTAQGSVGVYLTGPTTVRWWELFAPSLDTCVNEASFTPSATVPLLDPEVGSITLTPSSGSSVSLTWDSAKGGFFNDYLTTSTFRSNSSYRMQPMSGSPTFPDVGVDALVRTPGQPYLYTPDIDGSSVQYVSRYQSFSWTTASADWVLLTMAVWDSAGSGYQEVVNCVVRDDGSFSFDGSRFSSWPYSRQVDIYFGYAYESYGTMPWDGGDSHVVGIHQIYGAGFTY